MASPVLHPLTSAQLSEYLRQPHHALGLIGPAGIGVSAIANWVAAELLGSATEALNDHPYVKRVVSVDGKAIGIEAIRDIEQFLRLKVPAVGEVTRIVIVEDGQLLGHEAQNALLKTLEEPPSGTIIVVTAERLGALLPTIQSRLQSYVIKTPPKTVLFEQFQQAGYDEAAIKKAYVMTAGLPELMGALLEGSDHPLIAATEIARKLISGTSFERLLQVDTLSKQRALSVDVLAMLQQMAYVSLQSSTGAAAARWQRVLQASYDASEALQANGQSKLVLTDLMLSL